MLILKGPRTNLELTHARAFADSPFESFEPGTLLQRLRDRAGGDTTAVGFDFPIGVPAAYARRAGIEDLLNLLPRLGQGRWADFYAVASTPEDIDLTRPFYPMRPGGTKQKHLTDALGVDGMEELLRRCDRANDTRGAASPIFWTLGGKQVGKAAILGWREILGPALRDEELDVSIWPFDAMLGLLSMVEVALGYRSAGAPETEEVRRVEGWILGQEG